MKKVTIFFAILSIAILVYGIVTTKEIRKTFEINDNAGLIIDNINGSVKITGWDKDFVDVLIIKKTSLGSETLDKVDIVMIQKKDIIIETKHLSKSPKVSVSYELNVPKELLLKSIQSSNGSISITGAGIVDIVHTSNGSISLEKCEGEINADTSNGSITAEDIDGSVIANTSNGRIRLENITGFANANTSNGSIQIYNVVSIGNAKTSNGSIKAHIAKMSNDVDIKSSNGSITLYMANNIDADIKASTSNGKVRLHDFAITADNISKSFVSGFIGNGGNLLKLNTSNANIHIYSDDKIKF
ncbi:MAG: DUF4097 family beta strand repeat protein [Candidatus Cloacimonetes bacterium]|nr:DUF4097 family beta strand repeat protein [Candidatus Cloacimonadota bacterium]